jgi:hypothetical protein
MVIACFASNVERSRGFDMIKQYGVKVDKCDKDVYEYLYLREKGQWYEFVRFDENFIKAIEQIIKTNPNKHCRGINYEGCIFLLEIDDRFTDKRYWSLTKDKKGNEMLTINKDLIIDDLYNKTFA